MEAQRKPASINKVGALEMQLAPDAASQAPTRLHDAGLIEPQRKSQARPQPQDPSDGNNDNKNRQADHELTAVERADRYIEELICEVGQPSPDATAEARALWDRIERARAAKSVE